MKKTNKRFDNPDVAAVFDSYPKDVRKPLLRLRQLILETAASTDGVGALEETLKWGQPSYLTAKPKTGSTIRIDRVKGREGKYALYVHCQTNLVSTFREIYPDSFSYEGNRSIVFDTGDSLPEDELRHCISLALTYHLRKKAA
ncbi:MAG: DUF1801 domain-containing protein [Minwuiales bacterium]|nr:DUF1801 domain-containing protein [Minwuiales bacterium]